MPRISLEILWIFVISPLFLVLPGAFIFAAGACPCSGRGYLLWLAIQVYPAWIIAHALYHAVFALRCRQWRIRRLSLLLVLLYVALLVIVAMQLWFFPQVRTTNLLLGFIHGPIYDNWIPIDGGIIFARVSHILLGAALLAWVFYQPLRRFRVAAFGLSAAWLLCTLYSQTFASVGLGQNRLETLLPGTLSTPSFAMHYVPSDQNETPAQIQNLFAETKFHVSELRALFGADAPFVHVFVYPTSTQKKLWFGGGSTDVADIQTPSIHITMSHSPHPTLRHELVHALASGIGFHGLGFHPNMAFTEGLAVALAPEQEDISLHDGAAALLTTKRIQSLEALFSPLFWQESGARAYTVAGSIIKYLIDYHGIEPVKRLYAGEDWQSVFGASKRHILIAWRDFILQDFDQNQYALYAESLYRFPGVLHARCPHTKADYLQRSDDFWLRVRQPPQWDPDKHYWQWRLKVDPNDQTARLRTWSKAIEDLVKAPGDANESLQTWRAQLASARQWPPKTLEDVEMAILEADLIRIGERKGSVALLQSLEDYPEPQSFGEGVLRQIQARLAVEKALPPDTALIWRRYLAGWQTNLPAIDSNESWILSYLRIRKGESNIKQPDLLRRWLHRKTPPGYSISFYTEWYRFLGLRLIDLKEYELAQAAFAKAAAVAPEASKDYFDMIARYARFLNQPASLQ